MIVSVSFASSAGADAINKMHQSIFTKATKQFAPRLACSKEFLELIIHCISADTISKLELIKH